MKLQNSIQHHYMIFSPQPTLYKQKKRIMEAIRAPLSPFKNTIVLAKESCVFGMAFINNYVNRKH